MSLLVDPAPARRVGLVRRWLRLWRVEPVDVVSPLSGDAAQARLAAGLTTRRQVMLGQWGDPDARVVRGRVSLDRVRLTSPPRSVRNSWSPVFRGRLLADGAGCRLVGTIGWHPFVKGFTGLWLTFVTLFAIGGAAGFALRVAAGNATVGDSPMLLIPAVMLFFGVALVGLAGRAGWRDGAFLRHWLAEQLEAPGRSEVATVGP